MTGSPPSSRVGSEKPHTAGGDSPESLSPTAEALQALKTLASPVRAHASKQASNQKASNQAPHATDTHVADSLRIQAPVVRTSSARSSGAGTSGPASISPVGSGLSAPTSPADDGLDTPDSRGDGSSGPTKRPRLLDPSSGAATPTTTSTPTTPPLFLEKTYEMLDKCSPQIACWSRSGDSFIVKNPVAFAEHVIPIYFKHKNFSSFVRQLNFYGFRKVRVVDPDVTGGVDPKDWWEFRHDKFQRGNKAQLKEIKRRSLSSTSHASSAAHASVSSTGSAGTGGHAVAVATVDRAEIDELRTEVATLREQIQTLNKHMFSVMQIMMTRNSATPTPTPTPTSMSGGAAAHSFAFPSSHLSQYTTHLYPPPAPLYHHQQQQQHHPSAYPFGSHGPLPPSATGMNTSKPDKPRGHAVPPSSAATTGPGAAYALRPIQSFVSASTVPPGYVYPLTPSGDPSLDWDMYSRHAYHAAQAAHAAQAQAQAAAAAAVAATAVSSAPQATTLPTNARQPPPMAPASSVPAVPGLKRSRSQQKRSSPSASSAPSTSSTISPSMPATPALVHSVDNPEAAVRQLSLQVTQIRAELLQSILSRTLAFLSSPSASDRATPRASDTAIVEAAIKDDIQQRMRQINEAEAATHGRPLGSAPSETSHMYRVELLKFVSKELPRALSEAVEKRLPAATKRALNRSLLSLMVQRAQSALETQMRVETASSSASPRAMAAMASTSTGINTSTAATVPSTGSRLAVAK